MHVIIISVLGTNNQGITVPVHPVRKENRFSNGVQVPGQHLLSAIFSPRRKHSGVDNLPRLNDRHIVVWSAEVYPVQRYGGVEIGKFACFGLTKQARCRGVCLQTIRVYSTLKLLIKHFSFAVSMG